MPISYTVDHGAQVIIEVWTGDVSAADLGRYWEGFLHEPDVLALRKTLVDLRNCCITFSGEELSHLISTIVLPTLAGRDWKTALLVGEPVQYGVSRQYQVFAQRYSSDSIFYEYETALNWLRRQ